MYEEKVISLDDALKAMGAMLQEVKKDPNKRWGIAILDNRGELILFLRQDGARQFRSDMAIKKAYTAAIFRRNTHAQGEELKSQHLDVSMFGSEYTAVPGGEPVLKPGDEKKGRGDWRECAGAVGTSGAAAAEDERIAQLGAKVLQDLMWPSKK
ncbi:MAG: heme-binding protein [Dehalococcoidia bacterium]|nr:heme-binding protein [Dehalococcoidia bacterium]